MSRRCFRSTHEARARVGEDQIRNSVAVQVRRGHEVNFFIQDGKQNGWGETAVAAPVENKEFSLTGAVDYREIELAIVIEVRHDARQQTGCGEGLRGSGRKLTVPLSYGDVVN